MMVSSSFINIKNLQNEVAEREKRKIQVFEKVLNNCYAKILQANSKTNDCNCLYTVPPVMFGIPIYNLNDCIKFIMDKLNHKGFKVYFTYPNLLLISWKVDDTITTPNYPTPSYKQITKKPKTTKTYRPITDYQEQQLLKQGLDMFSNLLWISFLIQ